MTGGEVSTFAGPTGGRASWLPRNPYFCPTTPTWTSDWAAGFTFPNGIGSFLVDAFNLFNSTIVGGVNTTAYTYSGPGVGEVCGPHQRLHGAVVHLRESCNDLRHALRRPAIAGWPALRLLRGTEGTPKPGLSFRARREICFASRAADGGFLALRARNDNLKAVPFVGQLKTIVIRPTTPHTASATPRGRTQSSSPP